MGSALRRRLQLCLLFGLLPAMLVGVYLALPSVESARGETPPPGLSLVEPNDGEILRAVSRVSIHHTYPSAVRARLSIRGQLIVDHRLVGFSDSMFFHSSDLPNGIHTLVVTLINSSFQVVDTASVIVIIQHPVASAEIVDEVTGPIDTSYEVDLSLTGLLSDESYVVLASLRRENTYSPSHGLILPINPTQSVQISGGDFPFGYSGVPLEVTTTLELGIGAHQVFLLVLTRRNGVWNTTNLLQLDLD